MKTSVAVGGYARTDVRALVDYVQEAERLGVDAVWSAEAWGTDAVTPLAYLAGQTSKIRLGTGIMQISARVPSMTAMSALALHDLSEGRFILGLGVSGPQVVEGLQGMSYAAPLSRLRETVDIVRMAFRGEKLKYDGRFHTLPLPGGEGKPLRIDHEPAHIPIFLATLAPKSLEYTGRAADGWLGTSFSPDFADAHLEFIRRGAAAAGRSMDDIELHSSCTVAITDDVQAAIDRQKPAVAFQMGAMGSANTNFYNDAFKRAGFTDDALAIQELWIQGKRDQAAARVPDAMVTSFAAIGTEDMVRARLKTYADVGIRGLQLRLAPSKEQKPMQLLEQFMDIVRGL